MNIVIVGAGDMGRHIAAMLSKEQHNVVLIDNDPKKIEKVSSTLDIAVRVGSGSDWVLLEDLLELSPHVLLALTGDDETNLVSCSIARHLGYPRTVARVGDSRFLNNTRLDYSHIFSVDYFIAPELLVANDIVKYMVSPGSRAVEHFAHGAVQLRTLVIPSKWKKGDRSLKDLGLPSDVMVGLIRRPDKQGFRVIFPHGKDRLLPGDEVTFIGDAETVSNLHHYFGGIDRAFKSATIIGGSLTAVNLAKLLIQKEVAVKIIDKSYNKCAQLSEKLPQCTIVHHDATDLEFLHAEKIKNADILIACTRDDETNLVTACLAKEAGCEDVVAILTNLSYLSLVERLGVHYAVSPRISAANHILSQIFSGTVTSLISLYENQAEIMEINVSMDSKIVGIPLAELGPFFPEDFLIAVIQNRGRVMIANGGRIISPGDTVIVITSPQHVAEIQKMF